MARKASLILARSFLALFVPLAVLEGLLWIGHFTLAGHGPVPSDPTGAPRQHTILCVGDSHTYGLRVELRSYPNQLRARLEAAGPEAFAVINRGWPSFNSAQLVEELPVYLAESKPEYVFILIGYNNSWYLAGTPILDRLLGWSRTYKLAKLLVVRPQGPPRLIQEGENLYLVEGRRKTRLGQEELSREGARGGRELREVTSRDLRSLIGLVRQAGARPLLMTYASEANEAFLTVNSTIREVALDLDVPLVDQAAAFREPLREKGYDSLIFPGDHHCNAQGYALMIEGILAKMKELGWIDEIPPAPTAHRQAGPPVSVRLEVVIETTPPTLRLHSRPGLAYQLFLGTRVAPGPPKTIAPDALVPTGATPQFKGEIPTAGFIDIPIPSTYLDQEAGPLRAQAVISDPLTFQQRGLSDVVVVPVR